MLDFLSTRENGYSFVAFDCESRYTCLAAELRSRFHEFRWVGNKATLVSR